MLITTTDKTILQFCEAWNNGQETFTLYTSGSTGKPKPITVSREQMVASTQMTAQHLHLKAGDSALCCLNTDFIAGKMMLVRAMELGLQLTITPPTANPLKAIEGSFDFVALVPLQLQTILEDTPELVNRFKKIIVGGAPVHYKLIRQIKHITPLVYETYGMTETVSHIALKQLNGAHPEEHFTALDGISIETDSEKRLKIKGSVTDNKWIQTNDVVEITGKKQFKWLGRADNVINSGGIKIHPEEVERELAPFITDRRFFIYGLQDEKLGEKVCLAIEGSEIKDLNFLSNIRTYHQPKEVTFIHNFATTETGKVLRKETIALNQ